MAKSEILSIGFIPAGHSGGRVACGDPDSSGTREISVEIGQDAAMNLEAGLSMPTADASFFTEGYPLWALGTFDQNCDPREKGRYRRLKDFCRRGPR